MLNMRADNDKCSSDVVVLLNFETSVVLAKSNRLAFLVIELKMKY